MKERTDHCSEMKVACTAASPGQCDWSTRYRAVCRTGSCVAEPMKEPDSADRQPPAVPATITTNDSFARQCVDAGRGQGCGYYASWECDDEHDCRMAVPCEAACCQPIATAATGLDAEPWASELAKESTAPISGVLVFAAFDGANARVFVTDAAVPRPKATTIAIDRDNAWAAWVDGSRDVIAFDDDALFRVALGGGAAKELLDDLDDLFALDVSPSGDVLALAMRQDDAQSAVHTLDLATGKPTPVPGSDTEDGTVRWSPDGRLAFSSIHRGGRVAIANLETRRVDGRHAAVELSFPTWHPSGRFMVMWLEESKGDDQGCRLVLVTEDRSRYAPTHIWERGGYCRPFALSPDGRHVAHWRRTSSDDRLQIESLTEDATPIVVADYDRGGSIDWATGFTVAELGLGGG